jgi:circadian clock protein KaiB
VSAAAGTDRAASEAAAQPADGGHYLLRLYIAGQMPNSVQAEANLRRVCDGHLAGRHTLEVVDFLEEPERALGDGVLVTPTLLKLAPAPRRTVIGSLADEAALLHALGVEES